MTFFTMIVIVALFTMIMAMIVAVAFALEGLHYGRSLVTEVLDDLFGEVVVTATVDDDDVGLADRKLVFGRGFIRVRVLSRVANNARDLAVFPSNARGDIAVNVGRRNDVQLLSRASFLALAVLCCRAAGDGQAEAECSGQAEQAFDLSGPRARGGCECHLWNLPCLRDGHHEAPHRYCKLFSVTIAYGAHASSHRRK